MTLGKSIFLILYYKLMDHMSEKAWLTVDLMSGLSIFRSAEGSLPEILRHLLMLVWFY